MAKVALSFFFFQLKTEPNIEYMTVFNDFNQKVNTVLSIILVKLQQQMTINIMITKSVIHVA